MTRFNSSFVLLLACAVITSTCEAGEQVYVAFPNRVMTFDETGSALGGFSLSGVQIRDIAADKWGSIYVIAMSVSNGLFHSSLTKYDSSGNALGVIASRSSPDSYFLGLELKNDDTFYVGINSNAIDTVERFTLAGASLGTFATISGPGAPFSIVFDSDDNMYVPGSGIIEKFNSSGASLGAFANAPPEPVSDLAIDGADYIYAKGFDKKVYRISPGGTPQIINPQLDIKSIAVNSNDVLFVASGGSGGNIGQINTFQIDGTPLGVFATNLPGEPIDMVFATIVPEPNCLALLAIGLLVPIAMRKRK